MSTNLTRRSVAKGAAWSIPAVAVAGAAPAMAGSGTVVSGTICHMFYGGGDVNHQTMDVTLGIPSSTATIPQGTVVTWTFAMNGSTAWKTVESGTTPAYTQVPTTNYSENGRWSLATTPGTGAQASSFTVTWTALTNVAASEVACAAKLIWNDTYLIDSGVTVTMTSMVSGTGASGADAGLSWRVPRRGSTSTRASKAMKFISKAGADQKFPAVQYSFIAGNVAAMGTNGTTCAESGGNNSSTIYPDNSCAMVRITSGQATVSER